VVFFQVLNETNIREWTYQGKEIVLAYANELASVLKEADYQIATRMNLSGPRIEPAIEELENIDCNGPDPYTDDIEVIRKLINNPTKMPYIAENAAYRNTTSLMITSFANGGYYNVYMLGPNLVWSTPGIYDLNWEPWEVTFSVFNLNTALNKIGSLVSVSLRSQMVEFNTEESYPLANYDREKVLAGRAIAMKTWGIGETRNGAVGMAVHKDGNIYLIADRMAWFRFQEEPLHVSSGHLDESGNWVESHRKYWTPEPEGFEIPYHDGECLRVKWKPLPAEIQ
jgi:hypothetical protein